MTDVQFFSNNSVTGEENQDKFETCRVVGHIKVPKNCTNQSKGLPLLGDSLAKSGNFQLWEPSFHTREPTGAKFRTTTICLSEAVHGSDFWPVRQQYRQFAASLHPAGNKATYHLKQTFMYLLHRSTWNVLAAK